MYRRGVAERTGTKHSGGSRRRMMSTVAAGVCLVALLSGLWLWHRAPHSRADQVASDEDIPEIRDCGRTPRTRSDSGKAPDPISVPIAETDELYLHRGAPLERTRTGSGPMIFDDCATTRWRRRSKRRCSSLSSL